MLTFEVNDMTCGHCVSSIKKAVLATDKDAQVSVDLDKKLVSIAPAHADAHALSEAMKEAGYTPVQTNVGT